MLAELIKQSWLSEEEIIEQIRDDYDRGYNLAEGIRTEFEKEDKLFNYQKKNKDKIGDSTLFNVHSALMAREYIDKPTSKFNAHSTNQSRIVNNLNLALEADMNSSYMENLTYDWKHDKFLRWHGTIIRNGWDGIDKRPFFETVDPRVEILDPDGDYRNGDYSFYGFEKTEFKKDITEENGYEILEEDITTESKQSEIKKVRERDQNNFKMWGSLTWDSKNNPDISLYCHMAFFGKNNVRAMVWLANGRKDIAKVHLLPQRTKRVRAFDDILAITYHKPRRNNPYGDRIARYVGDVQIMKSIIANLRLDKIKAELYPTYLRNTRMIKNKGDLEFGFNKVIDANPLAGESLREALTPIQKDLRADNSYILDDSMDRQVEASTSIGRIAQWSSTERREWVGTNQLVQDNTDINLSLSAKVDAIWYEKLCNVWLYWYLEKFKDGDKKIVFIQTGSWSMSRELTKAEFLTDSALKITVDTVIEIEQRMSRDRIAYGQAIGLLQSIERPESAKLSTMRKYLASLNLRPEDIEEQIPQTAQETVAEANVGLLLEGKYVEVRDYYDPDTHLIAIKSAGDGLNVQIYKWALLELKKAKLDRQQSSETQNWQLDTSMKNNMMAQSMGQLWNEAARQ